MDFAFRESVSEFQALLREYPGSLRELREWPFHSESVFPEIGVVPRLLSGWWLRLHPLQLALAMDARKIGESVLTLALFQEQKGGRGPKPHEEAPHGEQFLTPLTSIRFVRFS